jgi:hypothetical protein
MLQIEQLSELLQETHNYKQGWQLSLKLEL